MKTICLALVCALALAGAGAPRAAAADKTPGPLAVAADAVVVRPLCLASTIVGSALFVVALPVAAASKSVKPTAEALVAKPAAATFKRPLGDLDAMAE